MKIGVIVIGLMILLASTAVVMGKGDPSRLFIEGNKVMILHYNDLPYKIELTGPIGESENISVYTGVVGRNVGKAKLFTVIFSDQLGTTNPTGDIKFKYDSDSDGTVDTDFELGQKFNADIWIGNELIIDDGTIEIIVEVEEPV